MKPGYVSKQVVEEVIEVVLDYLDLEDPNEATGLFIDIFELFDRDILRAIHDERQRWINSRSN